MASHFMSLPPELRFNICEMVMACKNHHEIYLYWNDAKEEMFVMHDPERRRENRPTPTALLHVCKKLHAVVSPIFHERVRHHLASFSLETGEDLASPEAKFIRFDMSHLRHAPKRVKMLSMETALAIQIAEQHTSKELRIGIASALPNLRELVVYNSRPLQDGVDCKKIWKRHEVISDIEEDYDVDADDESWPLHRLTPCKGHKYNLIQQTFFNYDEVCIATWTSSDHGFKYEWCRQEDAIAIVKPEDMSYFW